MTTAGGGGGGGGDGGDLAASSVVSGPTAHTPVPEQPVYVWKHEHTSLKIVPTGMYTLKI